jgi:uncharacterized protein (TIGR03437 family)
MIAKILAHLALSVAVGLTWLEAGLPGAKGQEPSFLREFGTPEKVAASAVAVDATGIYVAGYVARVEDFETLTAGTVRKYDLSGNELWTQTWPFKRSESSAEEIAVHGGNVYVAESTANVVRKYDSDGHEMWNRRVTGAIHGLAADGTGFYVAGGFPGVGVLRKYSGEGEEVWSRELSRRSPQGVAIDGTGIYVTGLAVLGWRISGGFLHKYTFAGEELWTRELHNNGDPTLVAVDANSIYVVGNDEGLPVLAKYDSSGNELWIHRFEQSTQSETSVSGIAVDATGIYIAGLTGVALSGLCRTGWSDAFVRKYNLDGVLVWTQQFSGSLDIRSGTGVAVDAGSVYAVGSTMACRPLVGEVDIQEECDSKILLARLEKNPPARVESEPSIFPGCVVNAASFIGGRVSPGEIVTIFGLGLGPPEGKLFDLTAERRLPTTLAGTRILFNDIAAPLVWVSAQQVNAVVPYAVAQSPSVEVEVEYQGKRSNAVTMPVAESRLGIFPGSVKGHALVLNQDGRINAVDVPAKGGSIITFFATGEGLTEPLLADGSVLGSTLPKPVLPVSLVFPNCSYYCYGPWPRGEVFHAGGAPNSIAGLLQVNVRLPLDRTDSLMLCVGERCSEVYQIFWKP